MTTIEQRNEDRKRTVSETVAYALEQARCAEINLDNMVDIMPALRRHPLLPLVRLQIKDTVETLEKLVS